MIQNDTIRYTMSKIRANDLRLLETVLMLPGATDAEIGQAVGLSRVQVSRRKNSTSFKKLLKKQVRSALKPLTLARVKAVRRLCNALDSADERIALKACEMILERVPIETEEDKPFPIDQLRKQFNAAMERSEAETKNHCEREENFCKYGYQMTNEQLAEMERKNPGFLASKIKAHQ